MKKHIKCIVSVTNSNGEPDLFFIIVNATEEQIENGEHYDTAKDEACDYGYEPYLVYDENDSAGKSMLSLFQWETASVIECN